MFNSFNSFSQHAINDSLVCLKKGTAVLIAKDLVRKDFLEKENILLKGDTTTLKSIITVYKQDSSIFVKKEAIYKSIGKDYLVTVMNYNNYVTKIEKKLKWSRFKTTISQIALLILGVFTITKL